MSQLRMLSRLCVLVCRHAKRTKRKQECMHGPKALARVLAPSPLDVPKRATAMKIIANQERNKELPQDHRRPESDETPKLDDRGVPQDLAVNVPSRELGSSLLT